MDQQPIQPGDSQNEIDETNKTAVSWRHVFDWGFWTAHPLAIFTMFLGGILLASITNFPGGTPKTLWYFAGGLWVLSGAIIWWVFGGIIARMEGRELLTKSEIEQRDQTYKTGIQTRLDSLEFGVIEAKKQIAEQRPRRLSPGQRQAIKEAVAPFSGQQIAIACLLSDTESARFAQDFAMTFREAGLKCDQIENSMFPLDFENARIFISDKIQKMQDVPPLALGIHNALVSLGVTANDNIISNTAGVEPNQFTLRVGARPMGEVPGATEPNK